MKINTEITKEVKEVLVKKEVEVQKIVIEVDQDFLDVINGIGKTSYWSRMEAGMSEDESNQCHHFYDAVTSKLKSNIEIKQNSEGEFLLL